MVSCIAQSRHMSTTMSDIASVYKDVLHFSARLWTRQAHCILCLISGSILIIFIIKRSFDSIFLINFCSWKCFYVWMDIKKYIDIICTFVSWYDDQNYRSYIFIFYFLKIENITITNLNLFTFASKKKIFNWNIKERSFS